MTGFDERPSIGDLNLQSTRDLPINKLGGNKESKINSRGINFKGGICAIEDLFKTLFGHEKTVNANDKNTSAMKEQTSTIKNS